MNSKAILIQIDYILKRWVLRDLDCTSLILCQGEYAQLSRLEENGSIGNYTNDFINRFSPSKAIKPITLSWILRVRDIEKMSRERR